MMIWRGLRTVALAFTCFVLLLTTILASSTWAQRLLEPAARAVPVLPVNDGPVTDIANMGSTYDRLDALATRVTTRFPDATAITERRTDGTVHTELLDNAGQAVATLDQTARGTALVFDSPARLAESVRAVQRPRAAVSADWSNLQAYSLWRDLADQASRTSNFEWQDGYIRPARRAPEGREAALQESVLRVATEFSDGHSAVTIRNVTASPSSPGRSGNAATFSTRFVDDSGAEVGHTYWFANEQYFGWSFPGLTTGYVDNKRVEYYAADGSRKRGWPFNPTMAWANIQSYAFYHFHTKLRDARAVVVRTPVAPLGQLRFKDQVLGGIGPARGAVQRLVASVAGVLSTTAYANEPGCDELHWLDDSIYRPCCDQHDRCYEKYSCNSTSWWFSAPPYGASWYCGRCNIAAVFCFITRRSCGNIDQACS